MLHQLAQAHTPVRAQQAVNSVETFSAIHGWAAAGSTSVQRVAAGHGAVVGHGIPGGGVGQTAAGGKAVLYTRRPGHLQLRVPTHHLQD